MDLMQAIESRRDTRHFTDEAVPKAVFDKALMAALHGPSVGLSQPCRFLDISQAPRGALIENFTKQRNEAETALDEHERLRLHRSLKLESLSEAPILLATFCAYPEENYTIGVIGNMRAVEWSCACAIQNLWLSLTADGYGAGWVTILDLKALAAQLKTPEHWEPMGILCIGKPATDYEGKPMLEHLGWKNRELKLDAFYSVAHLSC
jgi:5,6-dimethylbenzimidazole synthase